MLKGPDPKLFVINTIIGYGTRVQGDLILDGVVRIDGELAGVLYTQNKVIVSATGVVHNDIVAGDVIVGGTVYGTVYACDEVSILAGSKIYGDVVTTHLNIENGAIFEGNCRINSNFSYNELAGQAGLSLPPEGLTTLTDPRDTWIQRTAGQMPEKKSG